MKRFNTGCAPDHSTFTISETLLSHPAHAKAEGDGAELEATVSARPGHGNPAATRKARRLLLEQTGLGGDA
jgi:hypothetical protein